MGAEERGGKGGMRQHRRRPDMAASHCREEEEEEEEKRRRTGLSRLNRASPERRRRQACVPVCALSRRGFASQ